MQQDLPLIARRNRSLSENWERLLQTQLSCMACQNSVADAKTINKAFATLHRSGEVRNCQHPEYLQLSHPLAATSLAEKMSFSPRICSGTVAAVIGCTYFDRIALINEIASNGSGKGAREDDFALFEDLVKGDRSFGHLAQSWQHFYGGGCCVGSWAQAREQRLKIALRRVRTGAPLPPLGSVLLDGDRSPLLVHPDYHQRPVEERMALLLDPVFSGSHHAQSVIDSFNEEALLTMTHADIGVPPLPSPRLPLPPQPPHMGRSPFAIVMGTPLSRDGGEQNSVPPREGSGRHSNRAAGNGGRDTNESGTSAIRAGAAAGTGGGGLRELPANGGGAGRVGHNRSPPRPHRPPILPNGCPSRLRGCGTNDELRIQEEEMRRGVLAGASDEASDLLRVSALRIRPQGAPGPSQNPRRDATAVPRGSRGAKTGAGESQRGGESPPRSAPRGSAGQAPSRAPVSQQPSGADQARGPAVVEAERGSGTVETYGNGSPRGREVRTDAGPTPSAVTIAQEAVDAARPRSLGPAASAGSQGRSLAIVGSERGSGPGDAIGRGSPRAQASRGATAPAASQASRAQDAASQSRTGSPAPPKDQTMAR